MMNKDDLTNKLENLSLPEVGIPSHERRLKKALHGSAHWKGKSTKSLLKKAIPVAGIIVIGLIAAIIGLNLRGATPAASAQEIAQKSYQAVTNLPEDEQMRLRNAGTGGDVIALLEEAQSAKDLKVLTYSQVVSQNPNLLPPDSDGTFQSLRFLQFTAKNGDSVTIGLDSNDLPAITSKLVQGTHGPDGSCGVSGSLGPLPPGSPGAHGTMIPLDPSKCTYVQIIEPGPGPNIHGGPTNAEIASGGPCSPERIMQLWKNAKDVTEMTYDELIADTATKYHEQISISAQDPTMDAKIHSGKYLQFTDADGSRVTIGVDENNLPFWWQSVSSNSGCAGGTGVNTFSRQGAPTP
jgi:hypothetical protein